MTETRTDAEFDYFGSQVALPDGVRPFIAVSDTDRTGWERTCAVRNAGYDPTMRESLAVALRLLDRLIRERDEILPNSGNDMIPHAANLQSLYVHCPLEGVDGEDMDGVLEQCEIAIRG